MEYECPECGFVPIPIGGEISDPTFVPEEGWTYTEYVCPTCNIIILTTREPKQ